MSLSSRDIPIMLQTDSIPSAEETEELKRQLRELIQTRELVDSIPPAELQMMVQAANSSTIRRKGAK